MEKNMKNNVCIDMYNQITLLWFNIVNQVYLN